MVSVRRARRHEDHGARCRYQTIETIGLSTPLCRLICMLAASNPQAANHVALKPLRLRALTSRRRDGVAREVRKVARRPGGLLERI
jgi:hypothetical protein